MKTYTINNQQQDKITLLRHANLSQETTIKEASVSLIFDEVVLPQDLKVKNKTKEKTEQGRQLHFEFGDTPFEVKYHLVAGYDPGSDIDVAGNMLERDGGRAVDDDEKERWLEQARDERTTLQGTKNGSTLVDTYYLHTDTFRAAFGVQSFHNEWNNRGVVKMMAADTYDALRSEGEKTINDKEYPDISQSSGKITYNRKAYSVQSALLHALRRMKRTDGIASPLNPEGPDNISDKEIDATLESIILFTNGVKSTDNESNHTKPMTRDEVYDAVNKTNIETLPIKYTLADLVEEERYYEERMQREKDGLTPEEDRYGHEDYFRRLMDEIEQRRSDGTVLYEGVIRGVIPGEGFETDVRMQEEDGSLVDIVVLGVRTSDFEFDVDSEQWHEEYRDALEERLREVSFVSQSLVNVLRDGVGKIVRGELARYEAIHI